MFSILYTQRVKRPFTTNVEKHRTIFGMLPVFSVDPVTLPVSFLQSKATIRMQYIL
jgi:hypothetical protein